jgi:deoxyribodipyrimidine photolyase-related protein
MSDYCATCTFDPQKNCPITNLYWAFLARHEKVLKDNQRMKLVMASMRKRGKAQRRHDEKIFQHVRETLKEGKAVTLENLPSK